MYFQAAKSSGCSSIYMKNDTSRFSAYNNYYYQDTTGLSFEPIFMRFTWLVRVHIKVNSYFLGGTIGPIEPLIWGKCAPKSGFMAFIQLVWSFLKNKISKLYSVPHFPLKRLYSFCCPTSHFLKNGHTPKNFFSLSFPGNIVFY